MFTTNNFIRTWQKLRVRPAGNSKTPEKTQAHYCIWVDAISQYVYTPAYVQKLVELLSTEQGYRDTVGTAPRRKVSKLPSSLAEAPAALEASDTSKKTVRAASVPSSA